MNARGFEFAREGMAECVKWMRAMGISEPITNLLEHATAIQRMAQALTHKDVNRHFNYELLEALGDKTANKCIVWYLMRRFPQLMSNDTKGIFAELKMKYIQAETYARFMDQLGIARFIQMRPGLPFDVHLKIKEDVFEAVMAVIEQSIDVGKEGMGYAVCYRILSRLMDQEEIRFRLQDVHNPMSRLKELTESYPSNDRAIGHKTQIRRIQEGDRGLVVSENVLKVNGKMVGNRPGQNPFFVGVFQCYDRDLPPPAHPVFSSPETLIGVGSGKTESEARKQAVEQALIHLARYYRIVEAIPGLYRELNS